MKSELYKRMRPVAESYREQRFLIALPAVEFTEEEEKRKVLANEELLVQGVIDCFFLEKDGKAVLFDYKTDHFSKEELKDPAGLRGNTGGTAPETTVLLSGSGDENAGPSGGRMLPVFLCPEAGGSGVF